MAVYKSTRCYPFLNSLDTRIVQEIGSTEKPVQYLKCKVDTSNKKVTGYKIRILDSNNNVIFEPKYISPISELKDGEMATIYQSNGINSGLNGTYLYIPFFQSEGNKKTSSYNAMYYIPKYHVDHIVMDQDLCQGYDLEGAEDINADGWSKSSNKLYYNNGDDPVYLDGELVLEGQTVLFAAKEANVHEIDLGIYQVIKEQQGTTWYTAFKKVQRVGDQEITTVIRGKNFHNSNWKNNSGAYSSYQQEVYKVFTASSTEDKITGLSLEGTLYKWEITLYQGQGDEPKVTPRLITYSTLDNANYDMVAASGTILGSSSTRVQVASLPAFDTSTGAVNNTILPGLKEGTLVLQGTYMNFSNFSQNGGEIFNTLRHYVKSYDASYGHAYPLEGSVSPSEIEYNERVQFFKYTNEYDAIKEQDVVAYGVKYNIEFHLYDYDRSTITEKSSMADFERVGVNNRRYGINKMDLPEYVRNQIEEGDEILFTGQETDAELKTYPYENGVYRVYKINNTDDTEDADVSNILFLKRAASFNTWGSFIGKIIFCQCYIENSSSGSGSALNIESLAGASADSNLWNPDENSLSSGSGNLYFTQELPIMLFEPLLKGRKYDLRLRRTDAVFDYTPVENYGGSVCDGVNLEEGMLVITDPVPPSGGIYNPLMRVLKVVMSNNQLYYINLEKFQASNNYYYVLQGKTYGKRVYIGDSSAPNWDLYTGYILKNDCYQTYISPFVNVLPDMKIKFLNNKKARTVEGDSSWLPIQKVNSIVYCVFNGDSEGGYLENPLESEISLSNGTPWRYEVRTFFKASDGNPFYSYENPYLILYKNNQPYSTLFKNEEEEYWVLKNILGEEPFSVKKESDETTYQNFILNTLKDPTAVYGRSVKFSADYIQFDGLSWESYRWLLYNEDGDLLQDTGKKFDKTISVIFYGLSDDRTQAAIYYAVLEVRDEKQNQNIYVIKFHVEPAQKVKNYINFQASFDCNIHAMKLDFSQFGRVKPSFRDGEKDYVILDNYETNGGILFEEGIGAEIYNKVKVKAPTDYTYGSNISHSNGEENNELTLTGINGAPYYTIFSPNETSHDIKDSQSLFVEKQEKDAKDKGSFYFETAVCLDDNFCGSIVSWSVEKESNSEAQYPYLTKEGEEFSKNGFINFELMSAENFLFDSEAASETNYSLNPDRNQLLFKISVDESGNSKTVAVEGITLFDINEIGNRSYYSIQPNNCITDNIKNRAYEYLEYDLSYYPEANRDQNKNELYINRDKQGQFFAGNEDFFLTNLCMASETIKNNGKSFSYWDETRPFLTEASTNSKILQNVKLQFIDGVRNSDSHTDNEVQYWPSAGKESSLYWVERDDIEESPICWSDVLATDNHVTQMSSLKRHYGMSRYGYRLICQIKNVEDLYELISEDEEKLTIDQIKPQEMEEGQQVLSLTDQDNNDYGTITIIKYLI